MTTAFLRGALLEMRPLGPDDAPPETLWLTRPDARQGGIYVAVATPGGPVLGRAGLVDLDWVARRARLVAGWTAGARPPAGAQDEVVALLVAYARDELNLDALLATPAHPAAASALAEAGFVEGRWKRADPRF